METSETREETPDISRKKSVSEQELLETKLKIAIDVEDYEEAALLRDKIQELKTTES